MLVLLLVALSLAATIEQAIKVINMTIKKQVNFLFLICIVFHLLLRFILGRGAFRNDINDKCILCKDSDNSQEHVVNECAKTEKLRTKLTKELNDLDLLLYIKNLTLCFIGMNYINLNYIIKFPQQIDICRF